VPLSPLASRPPHTPQPQRANTASTPSSVHTAQRSTAQRSIAQPHATASRSPRSASAVLCTLCAPAALSGLRSAAALGHLPPNRLLRHPAQVGLDAGLERWLSASGSTLVGSTWFTPRTATLLYCPETHPCAQRMQAMQCLSDTADGTHVLWSRSRVKVSLSLLCALPVPHAPRERITAHSAVRPELQTPTCKDAPRSLRPLGAAPDNWPTRPGCATHPRLGSVQELAPTLKPHPLLQLRQLFCPGHTLCSCGKSMCLGHSRSISSTAAAKAEPFWATNPVRTDLRIASLALPSTSQPRTPSMTTWAAWRSPWLATASPATTRLVSACAHGPFKPRALLHACALQPCMPHIVACTLHVHGCLART
jgi:hypothetical protein